MDELYTRLHTHRHTPPESLKDSEPIKHHCLSICPPVVTLKKPHSAPSQRHELLVHPPLPIHSVPLTTRISTISGVHESIPDAVIISDFSSLYHTISVHVRKFYSVGEVDLYANQPAVKHATTKLAIPWPQVSSLLSDNESRQGALFLCISWTILSRSLLLNLGISHNPCCTFLPPKIAECFQSFCLSAGDVSLESDPPEDYSVNPILLSEWRQISATLMHKTHVEDAFSCSDSRIDNIEHALNELDTLLRIYADPIDGSHGENIRLPDLREILRKGAKFAFTLFRQPSCWQFDWTPELGRSETDVPTEQGSIASLESVTVTASELVIWPTLLRVMDVNSIQLDATGERQEEAEKKGVVLSRKKYLSEFRDS